MTVAPALPPGFTLVHLPEVGSTNDEARSRAAAGAAGGTLIWADRQLSGRGRRGRGWASPAGNLYCSLVLRPDQPPAVAVQVSFVAAVAVAEAMAGLLPSAVRVGCKWPNDVLIDGAKAAGILLESSMAGDGRLDWLVVGVGINVGSHPAATDYPATNLRAAGGRVEVAAVLAAYAERMAAGLAAWQRDGFAAVRAAWLARAAYLGQPIRVRLPEEILTGVFEALDEAGALVLLEADGRRRRITAGEVFRAA